MKSIISTLIFASATITGCGTATTDDKTRSITFSTNEQTDEGAGKLVDSIPDLPDCTPDTEGDLYYVQSVKQFEACASGVWSPVDLKGPVGDAGASGKDGKDGAAAPKVGFFTERGDQFVGYVAGPNTILLENGDIYDVDLDTGAYAGIHGRFITGGQAADPGMCYFASANCTGQCLYVFPVKGVRPMKNSIVWDGHSAWRMTGDEDLSADTISGSHLGIGTSCQIDNSGTTVRGFTATHKADDVKVLGALYMGVQK